MQYTHERRVFQRLREHSSDTARKEFERASAELILSYNTTIPENRFIVGGAMEVFVCALLRSVGIHAILYGEESHGGDILLPNDKNYLARALLPKAGPLLD